MKALPNVVYARLKYMWATGAREESLNFLRVFSASLQSDLQTESNEHAQRPGVSKQKLSELSKLLAQCYFKQGEWQVELKDDWGSVSGFIFRAKVAFPFCRETLKIFCILTSSLPTMTEHGIRPGTHGPWPILMSLVIWKPKLRTELSIFQGMG
jgi:FAT domain.